MFWLYKCKKNSESEDSINTALLTEALDYADCTFAEK